MIFDYNGTLLDDVDLTYESVVEIFNTYQLPVPAKKVYMETIGSDYMKFYWAHGIAPEVTGEDLNKIRRRYYNEHESRAKIRDDARAVLEDCKKRKLKLGIVSGEIEDLLVNRLKKEGLLDFFQVIRAQAWPKDKVLAECAWQLGCGPDRAVYVDDTVEGVTLAKKAGMHAVAFARGFCPVELLEKAPHDYLIYELFQLV